MTRPALLLDSPNGNGFTGVLLVPFVSHTFQPAEVVGAASVLARACCNICPLLPLPRRRGLRGHPAFQILSVRT